MSGERRLPDGSIEPTWFHSDDSINLRHKCLLCKKQKGYHRAYTGHCPIGSKDRLGGYSFSSSDTFQPDPKWKPKSKGFTI